MSTPIFNRLSPLFWEPPPELFSPTEFSEEESEDSEPPEKRRKIDQVSDTSTSATTGRSFSPIASSGSRVPRVTSEEELKAIESQCRDLVKNIFHWRHPLLLEIFDYAKAHTSDINGHTTAKKIENCMIHDCRIPPNFIPMTVLAHHLHHEKPKGPKIPNRVPSPAPLVVISEEELSEIASLCKGDTATSFSWNHPLLIAAYKYAKAKAADAKGYAKPANLLNCLATDCHIPLGFIPQQAISNRLHDDKTKKQKIFSEEDYVTSCIYMREHHRLLPDDLAKIQLASFKESQRGPIFSWEHPLLQAAYRFADYHSSDSEGKTTPSRIGEFLVNYCGFPKGFPPKNALRSHFQRFHSPGVEPDSFDWGPRLNPNPT